MVGDNVGEQVEPEKRNLRKNFALARNSRSEDMIEGRDAVGRDEQQRIVNCVEVAYFSTPEQRYIAQIRSKKSCHKKACLGGY